MLIQFKDGQLKGLFIIVIFEFKDPLIGLNPINIDFWVEIVIKF